MSRLAAALAFVALGATDLLAQPPQSFDELGQRVRLTDRVRITTSSGAIVTGRVARLSAGEIAIQTKTGEERFAGEMVREVAVRHRSTLGGAIVGAAAFAGALAIPECNGDPTDQCGEAIAMGAILGAGFGAAVGAFVPHTTVVYRRADKTAWLSPSLVPGRIGVVAALRW